MSGKTPMMEIEALLEAHPNILLADGFDDCIIGWTDSWNGGARPIRVVYDAHKCVEVLMRDGATYDAALDHFHYNTLGSYVGKETPIFVWTQEE